MLGLLVGGALLSKADPSVQTRGCPRGRGVRVTSRWSDGDKGSGSTGLVNHCVLCWERVRRAFVLVTGVRV